MSRTFVRTQRCNNRHAKAPCPSSAKLILFVRSVGVTERPWTWKPETRGSSSPPLPLPVWSPCRALFPHLHSKGMASSPEWRTCVIGFCVGWHGNKNLFSPFTHDFEWLSFDCELYRSVNTALKGGLVWRVSTATVEGAGRKEINAHWQQPPTNQPAHPALYPPQQNG